MYKAINTITKENIDISTIKKGDKQFEKIALMNLKCPADNCDATLQLCSFKVHNTPAPYFKSLDIQSHTAGCEYLKNTLGSFEYDSVSKSINGTRAFTKILNSLVIRNKMPEIAIYNNQVKTFNYNRVGSDYNTGRNIARSKVGPVIYQQNIQPDEGITYFINLSDNGAKINRTTDENGNENCWINFLAFGLAAPSQTTLSNELIENIGAELVLICKSMWTKNDRTFSTQYDALILVEGELYEKWHNGRLDD